MLDDAGKSHRRISGLVLLCGLIMPCFGLGQELAEPENIWDVSRVDPTTPPSQNDTPPSWIDAGHAYMTQHTNELTRWLDGYFGDVEVDQEAASSRLRLRLIPEWDERLGSDFRVRVGGKVNLPALSKKLDLVFRGDDPADDINGQEDPAQSRVGLQYLLGGDGLANHRFDATLGMSSSGPRPGLKYRYQKRFSPHDTLRITERIQYEPSEGLSSTARLDFDHALSDNQLIRSYSRIFYGQESTGVEWSSSVSHIVRWRDEGAAPGLQGRASMVFAELSGVTQPISYLSNYRLGVRYRRPTYRDYLFIELEPSYNWRVDEPGMPRRGAWKVELRFEFLLFDDLRRDAATQRAG